MRALLCAAVVGLLLAGEALAQSGGGGGDYPPRAIIFRPDWHADLKSARDASGSDPGTVLVVFVEQAHDTSRIQAEVKQRESDSPEFRALKNMGFARLLVKRKDRSDARKRRDKATANAKTALAYGIKTLPDGVVTDTFGNVLLRVGFGRLSGRGLLSTAKKARQALDKLLKTIDVEFAAGERSAKGGNKTAAIRHFEKIAGYRGYAKATRAAEELKKLKT